MGSSSKSDQIHSKGHGASRRLTGLLVAAIAAAALAVPVGASAAESAPPAGTLVFSRDTAKLVGETVLVPVRCVGAKGSVCSGELSVQAGGTKSAAPFSVSGGGRIVPIPVSGATSGAALAATAQSVQSFGALATSSEILHLR